MMLCCIQPSLPLAAFRVHGYAQRIHDLSRSCPLVLSSQLHPLQSAYCPCRVHPFHHTLPLHSCPPSTLQHTQRHTLNHVWTHLPTLSTSLCPRCWLVKRWAVCLTQSNGCLHNWMLKQLNAISPSHHISTIVVQGCCDVVCPICSPSLLKNSAILAVCNSFFTFYIVRVYNSINPSSRRPHITGCSSAALDHQLRQESW